MAHEIIEKVNLQYVEHLPEVGTPVLKKARGITLRIAEAQRLLDDAQRLLDDALHSANQFESEICGDDEDRQWTKEEIIAAKSKARS